MKRAVAMIGVAAFTLFFSICARGDEAKYWGFDASEFNCGYPGNAMDSVKGHGFDHGFLIEEAMFYIAESGYCKWDFSKIGFVAKVPLSEFAAGKVDGYIIYISRHYSGRRYDPFRSQFALLDDPADPISEGAELPLGIYRLIRIVAFAKANGFPVDIPLLERVAFPQN